MENSATNCQLLVTRKALPAIVAAAVEVKLLNKITEHTGE